MYEKNAVCSFTRGDFNFKIKHRMQRALCQCRSPYNRGECKNGIGFGIALESNVKENA